VFGGRQSAWDLVTVGGTAAEGGVCQRARGAGSWKGNAVLSRISTGEKERALLQEARSSIGDSEINIVLASQKAEELVGVGLQVC